MSMNQSSQYHVSKWLEILAVMMTGILQSGIQKSRGEGAVYCAGQRQLD